MISAIPIINVLSELSVGKIHRLSAAVFDAINCLLVGRLSKEEIEKMVRDAEKYKEEDDRQRDRLQAKNALESYAFNMKQTIEDDKLKDKISEDDRKAVLDKCNEVISWIDSNQVLLLFTMCMMIDIFMGDVTKFRGSGQIPG